MFRYASTALCRMYTLVRQAPRSRLEPAQTMWSYNDNFYKWYVVNIDSWQSRKNWWWISSIPLWRKGWKFPAFAMQHCVFRLLTPFVFQFVLCLWFQRLVFATLCVPLIVIFCVCICVCICLSYFSICNTLHSTNCHLLCLLLVRQSCASWGLFCFNFNIYLSTILLILNRHISIWEYQCLLLIGDRILSVDFEDNSKSHLSRKEERARTVERRLAASLEDFPKKSSITGVRPWKC